MLPAFGLVYLLAGPPQLRAPDRPTSCCSVSRRSSAGGWWVAIVQLWPASSRPYIGGSQNNSFWNVLFGYNGFGRLTGNESGSVGGGGQGGVGNWGPTGIDAHVQLRVRRSDLVAAAGRAAVARRAVSRSPRRAPRTDRTRAALGLWGGWLVVTGLAFSFGQGIIHEYYSVALAPAIGAIVGIGATTFWARRDNPFVRVLLGFVVAVTALWAYVLLNRTPDVVPAAAQRRAGRRPRASRSSIAIAPALRGRIGVGGRDRGGRRSVLAAPAAYTLSTVKQPHTGSHPDRRTRERRRAVAAAASAAAAIARVRRRGRRRRRSAVPAAFAGGFRRWQLRRRRQLRRARPERRTGAAVAVGGIGGLLNGSTAERGDHHACSRQSTGYRWTAAAIGANNAAGYQLASGKAVMAIGGFNGTDPTPTLAQFEQYVQAGDRSTTSSPVAGGGGGRAAVRPRAPRARSPSGSSRTSPPRPSAAPRSTT